MERRSVWRQRTLTNRWTNRQYTSRKQPEMVSWGIDFQQDTASRQAAARTRGVSPRFAVRAVSKYNRCQQKFTENTSMPNRIKQNLAFAAIAVAAILGSGISG